MTVGLFDLLLELQPGHVLSISESGRMCIRAIGLNSFNWEVPVKG